MQRIRIPRVPLTPVSRAQQNPNTATLQSYEKQQWLLVESLQIPIDFVLGTKDQTNPLKMLFQSIRGLSEILPARPVTVSLGQGSFQTTEVRSRNQPQ
jgi:hypothetical protein